MIMVSTYEPPSATPATDADTDASGTPTPRHATDAVTPAP